MKGRVYKTLDDLKRIRKDYGEEMFHMCRELFPTILEKKGLLYHIISIHFDKSKTLSKDIINENKIQDFKNYIFYFYDEMTAINIDKTDKSVRDLLHEKGYTLYECKSNEDIIKFRKYYATDEGLCTFRNPCRIEKKHVFFIVRDNANELDRNLFKVANREDEYGISVLCIQFDRGKKQRVTIISRYNDTVDNPNATYSNNLENIAKGLTDAFEREYNFNIGNEYKTNFELNQYVKANDDKYYKYNYKINGIYYCTNNIIIDNGKVIDKYSDKSRYTFMDYFILDEVEKKIINYDLNIHDSFIDGLNNITNIEIINEEECKKIILKLEDNKEAIIKLDSNGKIIEYENNSLEKCGDNFLYYNNTLKKLVLQSLLRCGDNFLYCNNTLQKLILSSLQSCKDNFLYSNNTLEELILSSLLSCGNSFCYKNKSLKKLDVSNLLKCKDNFLCYNNKLEELIISNLEECGNCFLLWNNSLEFLNLDNLLSCGDYFLCYNKIIQILSMKKIQNCGNYFMGERFNYNDIKKWSQEKKKIRF